MKKRKILVLSEKTISLIEKLKRKTASEKIAGRSRLRRDMEHGFKRVTTDTALRIAIAFCLQHPDFDEFSEKTNEEIERILERSEE